MSVSKFGKFPGIYRRKGKLPEFKEKIFQGQLNGKNKFEM